jgi:hypothetical protein
VSATLLTAADRDHRSGPPWAPSGARPCASGVVASDRLGMARGFRPRQRVRTRVR